jgi:MFS family permease
VLAALAGSGAANGLLPVTESFAVLQVTGSAGKLGIVLAGQGAVALLLSLAGGVAGDRFARGRILIASTVVRMAAAATLAATLLTHTASFGVLLGIAVVYGCASGFFGPSSTAVLPDIVPAAGWPPPTA